jgi:spore coat assembly protein SafA
MEYIIQPGDTLFAIARRFGITLAELLAANPQITNPDLVFPGQRIMIPVPAPPEVYVVRPGDTLFAIARRFGVTLEQLLAANPQITDPDRIFPGERINIPAAAPPPGTMFYTVQPGDTLFLIARRFDTTVETLLRLNPQITNPALIFPGQSIRVPAPASVVPPGCIVYVSTRTGRPELWRSNAAGEGTVQITRLSGTPQQPVANPQWSPDGRFIAYQAAGGLFVIDPCGRNPALLAEGVTGYSWANDSTRIAFSNQEATFIVDLEGNIRRVIDGLLNPVWFPGDERLAGSVPETDAVRFARLATVDVTGENFRIFDSVPARNIRLSPNGRYAGTEFFRGFAFGTFSTVYIFDFLTENLVTLPGFEFEVQPGVVRDLSFLGGWAPDSSSLVYSTLLSENGLGEIRIAAPQGNIRQSFRREYYPFPDWGPVAGWIIYTVSEQPGSTALEVTVPRDIYVLNIVTNRQFRVAGPVDSYSPDWDIRPCPPC